jgi:hypothetical protein
MEIFGPEDLAPILIETLERLKNGEIQPPAANAIGYLVSHLLKVYEYNWQKTGRQAVPIINIPASLMPNNAGNNQDVE